MLVIFKLAKVVTVIRTTIILIVLVAREIATMRNMKAVVYVCLYGAKREQP